MKLITPLNLFVLVLAVALAIGLATLPDAVASTDGVHGYISGRVTTTHGVNVTSINVILVNASNTSEKIPGFSTTVDQLGFYQFLDVPNGTFSVLAYGPYLSAGKSNNITVDENVTYWGAIVLVPQPYYGNMTVSENPIPLEGAKTEITITVYDYWENPVGPGWMVTTHTTAGTLDPLYGLTDANSQFRTTLTSPDNGSYAEINEFIRGWNGSYYPLQKRITVVEATPTPTPTPNPSPTAQPSVTPTPVPTAAPNATATPVPSASPTATAKPTPGFELAFGLIGIVAAAACIRRLEK
ncbi:MAG TPA: PGF-CTERM sorting domain-containing protein [Methanocella sp.]|jgi:PGF-CTERM protein